MYIIETGLKTGSFVNIMEIENKHIEDLIYSYLMGDISEEGRNELLQWLETDDAHKQCLSAASKAPASCRLLRYKARLPQQVEIRLVQLLIGAADGPPTGH